MSYTANAEDAKDLLQESTFRALKNHEKFKKGTNFKAWFFTIIKNTFINGRRKDQKKKKAIDTTEDMIVLTNNKEISTENPAHQNIQVASMQELINNLNEDLRKSFVLNFKGYTYQEIADMLHTPL